MKIEECLKANELFPEEGADLSEEHASYWFNSFCENIEVQKESSHQDSPSPDPVKRFLSYMAKRLLRIPCFDKVKKFAPYFDRCHTVDPSMVSDSPTVQAFCKLAAEDPKSDKTFDMCFLSQWPDRKLALQSSLLYSDYKKTRDNERLKKARVSMDEMDSNAMRLSIIKQLRLKKGSFSADVHDELLCIETYLTTSSREDRLCHLLVLHQRFNWVRSWLPKEGAHAFEYWGRTRGSFGDVTMQKLTQTSKQIMASKKLLQAVRHPIAAFLLKDWRTMQAQARCDHEDTSFDVPEVVEFVNHIFQELFVLKLYVEQPAASQQYQSEAPPAMAGNFGKALMKAVLVHQRTLPNGCTCSALKALFNHNKEPTDKKDPIPIVAVAHHVGENSKEPTPSGALASASDGDSEKKPIASHAVTHDGKKAKGLNQVQAGSTGVLSQKDISVGMKVRTVSHVNKSELDDKLAMVMVVNRASLWVKFLEGNKETHDMKRTYSQIKLCEPVVAVTPAGMQNDVETGEPDAKKKAAAILAIVKNLLN